jgi:hypothetical protein
MSRVTRARGLAYDDRRGVGRGRIPVEHLLLYAKRKRGIFVKS